MALIILCGHPCSGKSIVGQRIKAALLAEMGLDREEKRETITKGVDSLLGDDNKAHDASPINASDQGMVMVIDESATGSDRNQRYKDMVKEKNLRGLLRSSVDRWVARDRIVIVDSLNNIKGYRYELWCLARASGLQYCVVHCMAEKSSVREWNERRRQRGEACYSHEILEDLLSRFERPDSKNRWDAPLFEAHMDTGSEDELQQMVERVTQHSLRRESGSKALQPTIATMVRQPTSSNSLYELDRATQEVISAILEAQASSPTSSVGQILFGKSLPSIKLNRPATIPELQRHRRSFLRLAGQAPLSGPAPAVDLNAAKGMFLEYLIDKL